MTPLLWETQHVKPLLAHQQGARNTQVADLIFPATFPFPNSKGGRKKEFFPWYNFPIFTHSDVYVDTSTGQSWAGPDRDDPVWVHPLQRACGRDTLLRPSAQMRSQHASAPGNEWWNFEHQEGFNLATTWTWVQVLAQAIYWHMTLTLDKSLLESPSPHLWNGHK